MTTEKIDLYAYFGIKKTDNANGYLNAYIINRSPEYSAERLRPAMIVVPGGAYYFRSDRECEPVALSFISKGFNAFTLAYSVSNEGNVKYPYQLLEGCMAVAFVRENAEKYGIDPEHIAAVGFSAGGHLCAMLATVYDNASVKDFLGERSRLCRLDAVILSYPVITSGKYAHKGSFDNLCGNDEALRDYLSIENRVTANSVPAFIWCTADDGAVPSQNSIALALKYREAGVPFELHVFESGPHGLSIATEEVNSPDSAVQKWVELANKWLENRGFKILN